MIKTLRITIRVQDQEEALRFYTQKLGFSKRADLPMGANRRWVTVAPKDEPVLEFVLQPSDWFEGEERLRHSELVGKDPTIVFQVDDCRAIFEQLHAQGIEFSMPPTELNYGIEADAKDLYGNPGLLTTVSNQVVRMCASGFVVEEKVFCLCTSSQERIAVKALEDEQKLVTHTVTKRSASAPPPYAPTTSAHFSKTTSPSPPV